MKTTSEQLFIRAGSHRCRDKIERALGRKPKSWFSFYEDHAIEIREDEWALVCEIKGVTRARIKKPESLHPCWELDIAR